jgi:hypothetical protein
VLVSLLTTTAALAGAPFQQVEQAGSQDGHAYLRGETLLVGNPQEAGRPAVRVAAELRSVSLPESLAGFRIITERCDTTAERALTPPAGPAEGTRAVAWTQGDMDGRGPDELVVLEAGPVPEGSLLPYAPLRLALYRQGARVGELALELTAFPCELLMVDLDDDGRSELVLSWLSAGGSGSTRGVSVFE